MVGKIKTISIQDKNYPKLLKEIKNAPKVLYFKGEIFAVPGPIYSSNCRGTHYLIKNGAKLVESANDILKELDLANFPFTPEITGENKEENLILNTLKEEVLYIDKIIEKTKLSAAQVASTLAILEIKGKVRNLGGNIFCLTKRNS